MAPARLIGPIVCLALAACATLSTPGPNALLPQVARSEPEHYVVITVRNDLFASHDGVSSTSRGYDALRSYRVGTRARSTARAIAAQYHLQEAASWPIALLGVHCLVYQIEGSSDRAALLTHLQRDPRVESAQPLEAFATRADSSYNDPYASLQHNLEQLDVAQAQRGSRGAGVRLAIIDTGVDVTHADLAGRIGEARNFVDSDETRFRNDRHGTAVAGVVGAIANNRLGIAGIAPEARLLIFKACWEGASAGGGAVCNTFTLAQALAAAIEAHADIVNLSLGGPSDPLLARLVQTGQRSGTIFVGAAPHAAAQPGFPLDVAGVIGVRASESAPGSSSELAAPGEDIFTLTPGSHYDAVSGSSLAAAEVSGVLALLRARNARLSASAATALLARSSHALAENDGAPVSINACAALAQLTPGLNCTAPVRYARGHASAHGDSPGQW